jgi:hypothetical protein
MELFAFQAHRELQLFYCQSPPLLERGSIPSPSSRSSILDLRLKIEIEDYRVDAADETNDDDWRRRQNFLRRASDLLWISTTLTLALDLSRS